MQDKARARHWAEQKRKERNACAMLPSTEPSVTELAVPSQENSMELQDLLTRCSALLLELSELDIVIKAIYRMCN